MIRARRLAGVEVLRVGWDRVGPEWWLPGQSSSFPCNVVAVLLHRGFVFQYLLETIDMVGLSLWGSAVTVPKAPETGLEVFLAARPEGHVEPATHFGEVRGTWYTLVS